MTAVSYTHLDVYKRQTLFSSSSNSSLAMSILITLFVYSLITWTRFSVDNGWARFSIVLLSFPWMDLLQLDDFLPFLYYNVLLLLVLLYKILLPSTVDLVVGSFSRSWRTPWFDDI